MRIELDRAGNAVRAVIATFALSALLAAGGARAAAATAPESAGATAEKVSEPVDWQSWTAGNSVENVASLQRGARNFTSYCLGCHSLKYVRWSRVGQDLHIPPETLAKDLIPPGDKAVNYILSSMPAADAENWFGKAPPDLSLMARERGVDYLYQFLKTFYVDPTRSTGANNLRLPNPAMPDILSSLEGLKKAVYRTVQTKSADGTSSSEQVFDHFEQIAPGTLTEAQYDGFVRDTVNFLDYVGEPTQIQRRSMGIWVVLFLLVFTWLAWLMKKEYWKDIH